MRHARRSVVEIAVDVQIEVVERESFVFYQRRGDLVEYPGNSLGAQQANAVRIGSRNGHPVQNLRQFRLGKSAQVMLESLS